MQQRFLTDDEMHDARAMVGWQFWFAPVLFSLVSAGTGWIAASGEAMGLWLFIPFSIITIILWTFRLRHYQKFTADIEHRTVEVLEGAPQKTWVEKTGDCYLQLSSHKIKVPNDCYGALKDATIVRVAFLPSSHIAVRVDIGRGIGFS